MNRIFKQALRYTWLLIASMCFASGYGEVTTHKVAEGVYLFTTTPYADVGFCGNVTAIVTSDGVMLFDSGAVPDTARAILAELRKLTTQPVRYLVNSHWHWDHWGGNQVFAEAFPGLQIITHEKNREMMSTVEPRWNDRGLRQDLPQFIADFEKQIALAKANHASAEPIKRAEQRLIVDKSFLEQKLTLNKTLPNITFSDQLVLHMGGREIRVFHARAITPGDTYVFVPAERILITGDILLDPYPYATGGTYPTEWLKTLGLLAALQPLAVIPGHGSLQSDSKLIGNTIALFEQASQQIREDHNRGMSLEQTVAALVGKSKSLAALVGITADDQVKSFQSYFLEVFTRRAYREMDAPLGDLPDGIQ